MALIKKENICICEEYTDGQGSPKKLWRTIGELVTFDGANGQFQKVKLWGPGGFQDASVLEPRDNAQQAQQQQPPQQQGYQQQAPQQQPQQGYGQPPQGYQQNQ